MRQSPKLFVHIVTFNSAECIGMCLDALQEPCGLQLQVLVTDNASQDETADLLSKYEESSQIECIYNSFNLGFCGGQNQGIFRFLASDCDFYLMLNPDCRVFMPALEKLVFRFRDAALEDTALGACTGKILQADAALQPVEPLRIDSTGIEFTDSLRHFDRGNGLTDSGSFDTEEEVEGISGAFFLTHRLFLDAMTIPDLSRELDVESVYPQMAYLRDQRTQVFDEAFFAYRDDAELALRAQRLGWHFAYIPIPVAAHQRQVVPRKRSFLDPNINLMGVRNRFLLQLLHWYPLRAVKTIIPGFIIRNAIVLLGVLALERSSLSAFSHIGKLARRAWERRRYFEGCRADKELFTGNTSSTREVL